MTHRANARVVGHGTPKTWRAKCRDCGWQGSNTTRAAADKQAAEHELVFRSDSYYTTPCICGANPAYHIGHTQQCADAHGKA